MPVISGQCFIDQLEACFSSSAALGNFAYASGAIAVGPDDDSVWPRISAPYRTNVMAPGAAAEPARAQEGRDGSTSWW
jgi:hypothetical protein